MDLESPLDQTPPRRTISTPLAIALLSGGAALLVIPVNTAIFFAAGSVISSSSAEIVFGALALLQALLGTVGFFAGVIHAIASRDSSTASRIGGAFAGLTSGVLAAGGVLGALLSSLVRDGGGLFLGGAWGRPLRLRGRILHPELRDGSDWTLGERPDASALRPATRRALEALWLHDAQKEHASVPAFARVAWMLAAVGAPAELLEGAHRAALEEVDHTRRCFALAAGYGGRSHSVEPMPDLLEGGLDVRGDARVVLAVESLKDGCLLEDFNADVAAACERACEEPATRGVLARIAREERSHAELSWGIVEWVLERGDARIRDAVEKAMRELQAVVRPTAVSGAKMALVAAADPDELRAHGRLPDAEWAELWGERVVATERRARALLERTSARAAA